MRVVRPLLIAASAASLALSCGSSDEGIPGPSDAGSSGSNGSDASSGAGGTNDGASTADGSSPASGDDASSPLADAGASCQPGSSCAPGRTCLCCGTAGAICLCTVACKNDVDCPYSTQSLCNKPKSQREGICTPRDFEC